jgi:hypothetical protein
MHHYVVYMVHFYTITKHDTVVTVLQIIHRKKKPTSDLHTKYNVWALKIQISLLDKEMKWYKTASYTKQAGRKNPKFSRKNTVRCN